MTTLCQITMNAGQDIPGSVIQWNLKQNAKKFDRVIVVDGHLTDSAKLFYTQFNNVEVVDSPWEDSYVKQYKAWADKLEDEEYVLYLDCDEIPSVELINFCGMIPEDEEDLVQLPCILHITEDNKKYYPVEKYPPVNKGNRWVKNILIKKTKYLDFRFFGAHVIPFHHKGSITYINDPYYHMKSLNSFLLNDVWQAFLHPQGQQYTEVEAAQFKLFTSKYKTLQEFQKATREGEWPSPLVKFAWDTRWIVDRPISRLAWAYFIYYWNCPLLEDDYDFNRANTIEKYVLGEEAMNLLQKNKQEGNYIDVSDL